MFENLEMKCVLTHLLMKFQFSLAQVSLNLFVMHVYFIFSYCFCPKDADSVVYLNSITLPIKSKFVEYCLHFP